mmetsp:Transcript_107869/g.300788  ORF Transcript_107869/g.300788 Transcript_107869/m.300788 type:complete len:649 (-) Transcript_107869:34-1980(-)
MVPTSSSNKVLVKPAWRCKEIKPRGVQAYAIEETRSIELQGLVSSDCWLLGSRRHSLVSALAGEESSSWCRIVTLVVLPTALLGMMILCLGEAYHRGSIGAQCHSTGGRRHAGLVLATGESLDRSQSFLRTSNADGSVSLRSLRGEYLSEDKGSLVLAGECDGALKQAFHAIENEDGSLSLRRAREGKFGSFVSAQRDGILTADCDDIGAWQRFNVTSNDDGSIALRSVHGKFFAVQHGGADGTVDRGGWHKGRRAGLSQQRRWAERQDVGLCSADLSTPLVAEPPLWNLAEETSRQCFDNISKMMPALTAGSQKGRNWCWVGFKESGCHQHWLDHRSWTAMQELAVGAGMTINGSFRPLQNPGLCDQELGVVRNWTNAEREAAKAWLGKAVSVYVLSLPGEEERLAAISSRLSSLGMPFTVSWGVDLRRPGSIDDARQEGLIPTDFNVTRAQEEALRPRNDMGRFHSGGIAGTLGCLAGHFRAQRRAAQSRRPLAVIFENDVSPADDFVLRLWSLVTRELPCDWQVVSLASRCAYGQCVSEQLSRVQPDANEPGWRCHHGVNIGFQGMLYRVNEIKELQQLWKRVSFNEGRPHCLDVDVALAAMSDKVRYYAVPNSQAPALLEEIWYGFSMRTKINLNLANATDLSR